MRGGVNRCRKCGEPVAVITWGIYRKTLVDRTAIDVVPVPEGEEFIRYDGSWIRGKEAAPGTLGTEPAYRPHKKNCRGQL